MATYTLQNGKISGDLSVAGWRTEETPLATYMLQDEENQVRGFTLVMDYRDFGMSHFLQLSVEFGKRISKLWQVRRKNI